VSERTDELLDEVVRLLAISLRRGMETQSEAIHAFAEAGLRTNRIAELLGTTPGTVKTTRGRTAKKAAKPSKAEEA
jgi:DNA-binding CsgD family transcriptional regulator